MDTLVLGGNGFIGSRFLLGKLVAEGHNVTVFDKYREYFRAPLKVLDIFMLTLETGEKLQMP